MLSFVLLKSVPRFSHSVLIHFHYFVVKFNIVRSELATINLCPWLQLMTPSSGKILLDFVSLIIAVFSSP